MTAFIFQGTLLDSVCVLSHLVCTIIAILQGWGFSEVSWPGLKSRLLTSYSMSSRSLVWWWLSHRKSVLADLSSCFSGAALTFLYSTALSSTIQLVKYDNSLMLCTVETRFLFLPLPLHSGSVPPDLQFRVPRAWRAWKLLPLVSRQLGNWTLIHFAG